MSLSLLAFEMSTISRHPLTTTQEKTTHGHHQMVNTKIRLIISLSVKDGEALYSQQKQDHELTVAQIMNSLLPNTVEVTNRYKGLDLIDRVPEESYMEFHDIVQEAVIKIIPKKKKCKKAKWLSDKALQIAVKRKAKGKGEKERYTHLNAEFQRIARRDKKAFLSDQCKEIEENNKMGKTRDLFKKIRDTKGTFHAKMGSIKDRNGMDLTEAEDIKKR